MMKRRFADYIFRSYKKRKLINSLMTVLLALAALMAIIPLLSVFSYVLSQGAPALRFSFFTELPKPIGEVGGGMAHSLMGTLTLVFLASLFGIPWGLSIGIWLSEYGAKSKLSNVIRLSTDLLASIPSIIIGLFIYAILVIPMKRFSALAGGIALSILMIPTVSRTTEDLLKMVPHTLREAGLALGIPRWKVILFVILRGSLKPIITGVMLSIARISGETAPLLFTALNNRFWQTRIDQPISSLPVQIYTYAISPYEDWHRQAWGGALVLVLVVFMMNLFTRMILNFNRKARS